MGGILELLALLGAAMFAGGALYISIVEHPARMRAGVPVALAEFRQMYRRAAPWQASSAAVSLLASVALSILTRQWAWAVGGAAVGAVIPFTLLAMMATNNRLLDPRPPGEAEAALWLRRWGILHWVRSALGAAGLLILLSKALLQ